MKTESNSKPQPSNKGQLRLQVGRSIKERRIDKYLHGRFSNFSRVKLQKIIKDGNVKVNNERVKASFKLNPGDVIELALPEQVKTEIFPEEIPLNIIYEDDDIIVINKQADLIVHPARGNTHGTLVNALAYYSNKLSNVQGNLRPGIIHRLDRNTTGVMVVAMVKKNYLAIVHGCPDLTSDRINAPLGVHPRIREKYAIRSEGGKEAVTFYGVIEEFRGYSLMKLSPRTGRTHQIRVHLSYIKHPIVGDDMYGGKVVYRWQLADEEPAMEEAIINRPALHALALEFKHPGTGKVINFEAPIPEDMQNLLEMLRKYRSL
ncbi:MAG: RluA family pseudouridine synthase [Planctomycetota bacterium]